MFGVITLHTRMASNCSLSCSQQKSIYEPEPEWDKYLSVDLGPEPAETCQGAIHQQGARMSLSLCTFRKIVSRGGGYGISRVLEVP